MFAEKYVNEQSTDGDIRIADDVIAKTTIVVASHMDGAHYLNKDLVSEVADVAGKPSVRTPVRGVKVAVGEGKGIIDLSLSIEYGRNILGICNEVQEKVKESVENMTGLSIVEVNVHTVGVSTPTSEFLAKA